MKSDVRIRDWLATELGLASIETRHRAYRWLFPPLELQHDQREGFWENLIRRLRPKQRTWFLGMTSLDEQAYCEWYASRLYTGRGHIVELGAWLGALTLAIGAGLRRNRRRQATGQFHSYDIFSWHHSSDPAVKGTPLEGVYRDGDDFYPLFLQRTAAVADLVTSHKAELCTEDWPHGPIEFLVVDAMKYEALVQNIQKRFFPFLLPRHGILMHQDFLHFYEGWIHVAMYHLRRCFAPVIALPGSGTFVFRCRCQPRPEELDFPASVSDLSPDLIEEAYSWTFQLVPEAYHDKIAAAHTMMYVHRRELDKAERLLKNYDTERRYSGSHEFGMMLDYLREEQGVVFR